LANNDENITFTFSLSLSVDPQALTVECLKWREMAKNEKYICPYDLYPMDFSHF